MSSNFKLFNVNESDSDDSVDLEVMSNNSCMANSLNFYFQKPLFNSFSDFERKQNYNFTLSKKKNFKFSPYLSKRVRYKLIKTNPISKKKQTTDKFMIREPIFKSNEFGNRKYKLNRFLNELETGKYVIIYYFRQSKDNGKHYSKQEGHMVTIEKGESKLIKTISEDGYDPELLPHIDFNLNEKAVKSELRLTEKKTVGDMTVKIVSISIYIYEDEEFSD